MVVKCPIRTRLKNHIDGGGWRLHILRMNFGGREILSDESQPPALGLPSQKEESPRMNSPTGIRSTERKIPLGGHNEQAGVSTITRKPAPETQPHTRTKKETGEKGAGKTADDVAGGPVLLQQTPTTIQTKASILQFNSCNQ